jgi:hypothetical protein
MTLAKLNEKMTCLNTVRTLAEAQAALSGVDYSKALVSHHGTLLGWWSGNIDLDDVFSLTAEEAARGSLTVTLDDRWFIVKKGEVVYFV